MDSPLVIRALTPADLPFADRLRDLAGWNQTRQDWERLLALEPEGCFLAEWEGAPVGTATTTRHGTALAWIGMVLVDPGFRRRGIGGALLRHCLEHLRRRGVRCVKLDATPLGETLYPGLGFEPEWTLARWSGQMPGFRPATICEGLRPWRETDLGWIRALDTAVFGLSRSPLLSALIRQSQATLVVESPAGGLAGFGLLRAGARARYLGPVVAASDEAGLGLVEALIARAEGHPVFWDLPDANAGAGAWAERHGWAVQRRFTRMFHGDNPAPGDPRRQFALSGPETG